MNALYFDLIGTGCALVPVAQIPGFVALCARLGVVARPGVNVGNSQYFTL